jgi:catechol 2,3-dioxygenase
MKVGHVHLKIRNLIKSIDFYQKYLGMEITEQLEGSFAFMSAGEMHHELALQEVGEHATAPQRHQVGLYHVAFEVPSRESLSEIYQKLSNAGIEVYPTDHRISWALYFSDPDGNGIEVYWDTRNTEHGVKIWQGVDRHLTPAQLADKS